LAWVLCLALVGLLGWLIRPLTAPAPSLAQEGADFAVVLWQQRALDVWVQMVLMFAGVLGVLGLLAEVVVAPVARDGKSRAEARNLPARATTEEADDVFAH
jgi:hypothetical protein